MFCNADLVARSKADLVVRLISVRLLRQEYETKTINEEFNVDNSCKCSRQDNEHALNREI